MQSTYDIVYPSGKRFTLSGEFQLVDLGPLRLPVIQQPNGRAHILDQRAIVSIASKQVYHPRRNVDGLDRGIAAWLGREPDW